MKNTINISVKIEQSLDKVWEFWNAPEHITNWNFASDEWCCPSAENDLKVGGKLKSRMEAKDGSFGFDFEATYDEIIDLEKITYSIADGRQVTINFKIWAIRLKLLQLLKQKAKTQSKCNVMAGKPY